MLRWRSSFPLRCGICVELLQMPSEGVTEDEDSFIFQYRSAGRRERAGGVDMGGFGLGCWRWRGMGGQGWFRRLWLVHDCRCGWTGR